MKRLSLLVGSAEAAKLISEFCFLRAVEIMDITDADSLRSHHGFLCALSLSEDIARLSEEQEILRRALTAAAPYRTDKKSLFKPYPVLSRQEFEALENTVPAARKMAEELLSLCEKLAAQKEEMHALEAKKALLSPWEALSTPLDFSGTEETCASLSVLPPQFDPEALVALLNEQGAYAETISRGADGSFLFVLFHKSKQALIAATLAGFHTSAPALPSAHLSAGQLLRENEDALGALRAEHDETKDRLIARSKECALIEYASDYLDARLGVLRYREQLLYSDACAFLQGYLCERDIPMLETMLRDLPVAYELADIAEGEEPPVALYNKPIFRPFESVIALYSYPAYRGFDPTVIMSFFYFILFGMMLADVVYGALMTLCCLLFIRIAKPRKGLRQNLQLFSICGISMMICGVLFGGYMGDLPVIFSQKMLGNPQGLNLALLVDPVKSPMDFLYLSVGFGGLHLLCGMGIKFYMLCRARKVWDAICDVGMWYLVFAGIILLLLGLTEVAKWTALAGVAGLVLTQGRHEKNPIKKLFKGLLGLYGIINYASDLLSYSRVLALGLASAVIASVINTMATLFGPSVLGYLIMTVILIFGHIVNILINLLGAYVHTGRLQYIEFFGKFYEDGGRPFKPLSYEPKHFDLAAGEEK